MESIANAAGHRGSCLRTVVSGIPHCVRIQKLCGIPSKRQSPSNSNALRPHPWLSTETLVSLQNVTKGFSADNVLTMQLRLPYAVERTFAQPSQAYQRMLDSIAHAPGVASAAFVTSLPLRGGAQTTFSIPDSNQDTAAATRRLAQYQIVSPVLFCVADSLDRGSRPER
jgi:hypothetical protein